MLTSSKFGKLKNEQLYQKPIPIHHSEPNPGADREAASDLHKGAKEII